MLLMPSLAYKLHIANPVASNTINFSTLNSSRNFIYDTKYKRPEIEFLKYNEEGNLLELIDYSNVSTSYLWGYRNRLPIAEVRNVSYTDVESTLTASTINNLKNNVVTESVIRSTINNLRTSVDRKVTTYTHDVLYGLKSSTDPSNISSFYNYDGLGRLKTLTDKDNNILKNYRYQYASATGGTGCTVVAPTITSAPASSGCSTVLTASACAGGTITWSNSQTGGSITVPSVSSPTYTATCTTTCTSPASNSLAGLTLPSGWNGVEIGAVLNGCLLLGNSQVTMKSNSSTIGIGGSTVDNHYFYQKTYSGNVTIMAKIVSMTNSGGVRVGLMFKGNTGASSQFYSIVQQGDNIIGKIYREADNNVANILQYTSVPTNVWLKIKKVGNVIQAYYSTAANPSISDDIGWIENLTGGVPPTPPNITWGSSFVVGTTISNTSSINPAEVIFSNVLIDNNGVLENPF
jgi:YD repeat-containing protein